LVSGCALIVDYVLTIAISIASGADAIFSFMPVPWLPYKFWLAVTVVVVMVAMNLRGVKESVIALLPIFLAFVLLHIVMVGYAFLSRAGELPVIAHDAVQQARLVILPVRVSSPGTRLAQVARPVPADVPIIRNT
jgi:amino acid transporter